jgi:hypothetical protein
MSLWKAIAARWGTLSEVALVRMDALTDVLMTVDYGHGEVHAGSAFLAESHDTAMADTDTLVMAFKTPSGTKRAHMMAEFVTMTGGYLELVEGATWDASSGTAIPIANRKRETSMNSSILLEDRSTGSFIANDELIENPTTFAGGSALPRRYAFGVKTFYSGESRSVAEVILKPDTQYGVRFTSTAAGNEAQILLHWYEHTDAVH